MKNLLKRTISLILAFAMCLCLVACGEIKYESAEDGFKEGNVPSKYIQLAQISKNNDENVIYSIKLDEQYQEESESIYSIKYGVGDVASFDGYTLEQLKQGVNISLTKSQAETLVKHIFVDSSMLMKKPSDNGKDYSVMSKAFGLDKVVWHTEPKTDLDFLDNFVYSYLRGAWEIDTEKHGDPGQNDLISKNGPWIKWLGSAGNAASVYNVLLGEWVNCFNCCVYLGPNGKFYVYTYGADPVYSKDEIMQHLEQSYQEALKLKDDFHKQNEGKVFGTQEELAQAYYKYLLVFQDKRGFKPGSKLTFDIEFEKTHPGEDRLKYLEQHPEESIANMEYDGVYGYLILNKGECSSHAELFNMLMNMEGIETYGLCGEAIGGGGHMVSYLVLDDQTYLCDWNNRLGVFPINDTEKKLRFLPREYSFNNTELVRYQGDTNKCGNEYNGKFEPGEFGDVWNISGK